MDHSPFKNPICLVLLLVTTLHQQATSIPRLTYHNIQQVKESIIDGEEAIKQELESLCKSVPEQPDYSSEVILAEQIVHVFSFICLEITNYYELLLHTSSSKTYLSGIDFEKFSKFCMLDKHKQSLDLLMERFSSLSQEPTETFQEYSRKIEETRAFIRPFLRAFELDKPTLRRNIIGTTVGSCPAQVALSNILPSAYLYHMSMLHTLSASIAGNLQEDEPSVFLQIAIEYIQKNADFAINGLQKQILELNRIFDPDHRLQSIQEIIDQLKERSTIIQGAKKEFISKPGPILIPSTGVYFLKKSTRKLFEMISDGGSPLLKLLDSTQDYVTKIVAGLDEQDLETVYFYRKSLGITRARLMYSMEQLYLYCLEDKLPSELDKSPNILENVVQSRDLIKKNLDSLDLICTGLRILTESCLVEEAVPDFKVLVACIEQIHQDLEYTLTRFVDNCIPSFYVRFQKPLNLLKLDFETWIDAQSITLED